MATDNSTIMAKCWLRNSNDFQQRIPEPTQGNIAKTVQALFDPMNRNYFNDFMNVLINRIAFSYVHSKIWENKLAVFKKQKVNYGSTIQEIAPKWIKAHSYDVSDETLLKLNRPEAGVWYHSQNRQDRYDISISYDDLRTAFTEDYGLNNFIAAIMETPINSDNYDEYRLMMQLVAEYDTHFGFFKKQVTAPTNEATAKAFLKELRADAELLTFPSARYNAANVDVPVFINDPKSLVLFITPGYKSSLDVDALSVLFHLEKAEVQQRIVVVDEFPLPDIVAILTTEDFLVCNDTVYENTSFWNPQTLANNYYLHHWGIYSVSPFVPAICYTTDSGTTLNTVTQTITGLVVGGDWTGPEGMSSSGATITIPIPMYENYSVKMGAELTGTITASGGTVPNKIKLSPNAVTYNLENNDTAVSPDIAYIDRNGYLVLSDTAKNNLVNNASYTVVGTSTYINPSGSTSEYTATATITFVSE